jgi:hypothetical protein
MILNYISRRLPNLNKWAWGPDYFFKFAGMRIVRNISLFYLQTDLKTGLSEEKARNNAQTIIREENMTSFVV